MIAAPLCSCTDNILQGKVTISLPDGWRAMAQLAIEEASTVECSECGSLLKPPCTIYRDGRLLTLPLFLGVDK